MFSSKIIRGGKGESRPVSLGPLGEIAPTEGEKLFVPATFAEDSAAAAPESALEESLVVEVVPSIPEAEALARIEAAYQDGVRDGRREAETELSSVSEGLAKALISVGTVRQELFHEAEEDLLRLSVAIARSIILREIAQDPVILAGMVQGAVEAVAECDELVVRLNPDDHHVVAQSQEFAQLSSEKKRIVLKGDASVERGGCLVETVRGNVDARLESQLDEIYRRLAEERSCRKDEPDAH